MLFSRCCYGVHNDPRQLKFNLPSSNRFPHEKKILQEATSVVAQGQIIPVLPGGPLYQSIGAGEMAIREVLYR